MDKPQYPVGVGKAAVVSVAYSTMAPHGEITLSLTLLMDRQYQVHPGEALADVTLHEDGTLTIKPIQINKFKEP